MAGAAHVGDWLLGVGVAPGGAPADVEADAGTGAGAGAAAGKGVPMITRGLLSIVTFSSYGTGSSGAP